MNGKFSYDAENDILFIHKGFSDDEKFKGNIDVGDLVLDLSTKGRIRGIEIMNVTKFFKKLECVKIKKIVLESMCSADFHAITNPNGIILSIIFRSKNSKEIRTNIALPLDMPAVC